MNRSNRRLSAAAAAVVVATQALPAGAAVKTWDGGGGTGSWNTASNWDPAGAGAGALPANGDQILLDNSGIGVLPATMTTLNFDRSFTHIVFNSANTVTWGNTGNGNSNDSDITLTGATGAGSTLISMSAASSGTFTIASNATAQNSDLSLILGNSGIMEVANAAGTLSISASIGESAVGMGITKTGAGLLVLSGANTFSGATTVSAGTLRLSGGSALNNAVAVNVASGATLNITTNEQFASLNNSGGGGGSVTLNAGVTLTNGAASGTATFDGSISGATGAYAKSGAYTQILNGTLSYGGATSITGGGALIVNGTHSGGGAYAIGNGGSTLGGVGSISANVTATGTNASNKSIIAPGATTGASIGTLSLVGTVTFATHGRLLIDVNGATADRLSITGNLDLDNSNNEDLIITAVSPTAGKYTLISYSGSLLDGGAVNGFSTVTGIPTNYRFVKNTTDKTFDLRHRSTLGTIVATPAAATIITGGSTAVSFTIQNTAPTDSFDLVFTGTAGSNMTGAASGTVAANSTGGPSSNTFAFNGTTVGLGQLGSFSLADAEATNSPQNGSVSVNVLAHSNGSFSGTSDANTLLIDFGTVSQNAGGGTLLQGFDIHNLLAGASPTAGLDLDSFGETGDTFNKFSSADLATFLNLAAGSSDGSTIDFNTTSLGTFSATYTLNLSDQNLPGATGGQTLTLNLTGTVVAVPEPTSLGLIGVAGLLLLPRRFRGGGRRTQ